MPTQMPVRESVLEVSNNSWIIGGKILLSRQSVVSSSACSWSDGTGGFYTVSNLTDPPLRSRPLPPSSPLQLVHDAGDCNAAWKIGEAFLKVQNLSISTKNRTREHTTLAYLHNPVNGPVPTFPIPQVIYHNEFDNRYYLITSKVPGETLEKAWPTLNETAKQTCVKRVVDICKELAQRKSDKICGIDGGDLSDNWMKPLQAPDGYSPESLFTYCQEIGMDCSVFVLHHCDMGPTNIVVDEDCNVGLIDWEVTGFVPKEWIRTKFCICWAMDFDFPQDDIWKSRDWRQRVQIQLAQEGFLEVADAWKDRFQKGLG